MTRRSRIWLVVAVLFVLVNVAGVWMAAREQQMLHTGIHVALALAGAFVVRWIATRRVLSS